MKKCLTVLFLTLVLFVACSQNESTNNLLTGDKPPSAIVVVGAQREEMVLGTYCWNNGCVDTIGTIELLEDKEPIKVKPEEVISFEIDYKVAPSETILELEDGVATTEIPLTNNSFTAPAEEGIYYYSYGVWWNDSEDADVSLGDAFYAFVLEVGDDND